MSTNPISEEARELALKRLTAMTEAEISTLANQQRTQDAYEEAERLKAEQKSAELATVREITRAYESAERGAVDAWVAFADALIAMRKAHVAAHLDPRVRDRIISDLPDARVRELWLRGEMIAAMPKDPIVSEILTNIFGIRHLNFG